MLHELWVIHLLLILLNDQTSGVVALELGHVALVAALSESVVEVLALVAGPVSWSEFTFKWVGNGHWLSLFLLDFTKRSSVLSDRFFSININKHVLWLSFGVTITLAFLTSEALFSSFEVVVLAGVTLPSTFWESELFFILFELLQFCDSFDIYFNWCG